MQLNQLRMLHRLGKLNQAIVTPSSGDGWCLQLQLDQGELLTMEKSRPERDGKTASPRVFQTIDAAVRAAGNIGFSEVTVTAPVQPIPKPEDFRLR